MTIRGLAAAALLLLAGGLWAGADDNRFALVIGNAAYDGDMALANPANDANAMATTLSGIGWKVTKLINGDRKTMNRTIAQFRDVIGATPGVTTEMNPGAGIGGNIFYVSQVYP